MSFQGDRDRGHYRPLNISQFMGVLHLQFQDQTFAIPQFYGNSKTSVPRTRHICTDMHSDNGTFVAKFPPDH